MSDYSTAVVDDLKTRLMSTTKEFQDIITMRTENLKVHESRRQLFSSTASIYAPAPTWASGLPFWSQLFPTIDENMDATLANVEGAQGALLKYLNSISSNGWLMIKIFIVLIFFLMVFIFFLLVA